MSNCSPKTVIVLNRAPAPFAQHWDSLPIGRDYRSAARSDRGPFSVTLRDPIGRETPRPFPGSPVDIGQDRQGRRHDRRGTGAHDGSCCNQPVRGR
jgi:hypothetical protein